MAGPSSLADHDTSVRADAVCATTRTASRPAALRLGRCILIFSPRDCATWRECAYVGRIPEGSLSLLAQIQVERCSAGTRGSGNGRRACFGDERRLAQALRQRAGLARVHVLRAELAPQD